MYLLDEICTGGNENTFKIAIDDENRSKFTKLPNLCTKIWLFACDESVPGQMKDK